MRVPSRLRERLLALFRKERIEGELAEEIQFHIEMETEKNIRLGLSAKEARRAALLKFGGVERTKEEVRGERGVSLIEEAVQDLRYGARALRQNRGFAFAWRWVSARARRCSASSMPCCCVRCRTQGLRTWYSCGTEPSRRVRGKSPSPHRMSPSTGSRRVSSRTSPSRIEDQTLR
jgi:hypothetical protein